MTRPARLWLAAAAAVSLLSLAAGGALYLRHDAPYAGQDERAIKALSARQIEGYLNGDGMGYAKAAELNRYPGPRHVLELKDALALTPQQTAQTQALFDAMKQEASALGAQRVEQERQLDQWFAGGGAEAAELESQLLAIGAVRARIRYAHLKAHIAQKALLSEEQVAQYEKLRGYGGAHARAGHAH